MHTCPHPGSEEEVGRFPEDAAAGLIPNSFPEMFTGHKMQVQVQLEMFELVSRGQVSKYKKTFRLITQNTSQPHQL